MNGGPDAISWLTLAIKIFGLTGLLALAFTKKPQISRWISGLGGAFGGLLLLGSGFISLEYSPLDWPFSLPSLFIFGQGAIHLDPLSGLFTMMLGGISLAACVYGIGYNKMFDRQYSHGWLGAMTNWFIASMAVVLVAAHALTFLFAWEIMALTSFALVVYQHAQPEARQAGFIYAIMTQIGTSFLIIVFVLFSLHTGSLQFSAWYAVGGALTPHMATLAFFLLLLGFGTKAGLVPMHMWLPEAHPQAPSPISALMSGVMIKVAVYAFIRVFGLTLVDSLQPWWGIVVMGIGAISALVGMFYALERRDMKKALAYSSIENIGLIFIGVGASMYFLSIQQPGFAFVAAVAAVLHTVNHAVLKSLMFLGAGSVYYTFHTRSMQFLGGAAKILPITAVVFLFAAIGLMGLPPTNVSKWLLLQSILSGVTQNSWEAHVLFPFVLAAFALAAGLSFVVFTRMFGIVFLGLQRQPMDHTPHPKPTPWTMNASMLFLAITSLGLAIFNPSLLNTVSRVMPKAWFSAMTVQRSEYVAASQTISHPFIQIDHGMLGVGVNTWVYVGLFLGLSLLSWVVIRLLGGKQKKIVAPSWDCGFPLTERMQYSSLGFTSPVRHALRYFMRPKETVHVTKGQDNFYFWHERAYTVRTLSFFDEYVVKPISLVFIWAGASIKRIQSGHIYSYLTYMVIALIVLLVLARHL